MVLTVLLAAIFTNLILFSGLWLLKQRVNRFFRDFFTAPDENTPSPYAALVDTAAERFASRVVASAKGTFMGMQSVDSRNEKRVNAALQKDLVSLDNPLIGQILESFPAAAKLLDRNPGLYPMVGNALAKLLSKKGGVAPDEGNGDYAQRLKQFQ